MTEHTEQPFRPQTLIQQNIIVVSAVFVACLMSGVFFSWSVTTFVDRVANAASGAAVQARIGMPTVVAVPGVLGAATDVSSSIGGGYSIQTKKVRQFADKDGNHAVVTVLMRNITDQESIYAPYEQWAIQINGTTYRPHFVRPIESQNSLLPAGQEREVELDFLVQGTQPIEALYFQQTGNAARNLVPLAF